MKKAFVFTGILFLITTWLFFRPASLALEKVKFGTSTKGHPSYYLPVLAAEEKGLWKEGGLEAEWIPFTGGTPHWRAVSAKLLEGGIGPAISLAQAVSRGVPAIIVAGMEARERVRIWVRADSPVRDVRQLAGRRTGVARLGGMEQAYGRMVAKALAVEEFRFVGAGGVQESIAMLRTGAIDALVRDIISVIFLLARGEVREVAKVDDFLPQEWIGFILYSRSDLVKEKPEMVRRMTRAVVKATSYIPQDSTWAREKIKAMQGVSDQVAQLTYEQIKFIPAGHIDPKAVENVLKFLLDYGIIPKDKAPALSRLFTDQFIR